MSRTEAPEDHTLVLLREMRATMERRFDQIDRKIDRVEGELLSLRDREQARTIDMNRLERSDLSRDSRLREIEERLDRVENEVAR